MICLNCKKQIPDDSVKCPECGTEVFHKEQVKKEIAFRRYQRWFFYAALIIVFSGMTAAIVKVYMDNSNLLIQMATSQQSLETKDAELELIKSDLEQKAADLEKLKNTLGAEKEKLSGDLTVAETELSKKIDELSKAVNEKLNAIVKYERVNSAFLNIAEVAAGISEGDLRKIPVADVWPVGPDADGDGIPDEAEIALGTSATSSDSDGDGFTDKDELLGNFNPVGEGSLGIDQGFADKQKGKVFKQAWGGGYLWYVGQEGKRYFLAPIQKDAVDEAATIPAVATSTPISVTTDATTPIVPAENKTTTTTIDTPTSMPPAPGNEIIPQVKTSTSTDAPLL
jgi:predicted nucleic acid-binding Zn ribbon protein